MEPGGHLPLAGAVEEGSSGSRRPSARALPCFCREEEELQRRKRDREERERIGWAPGVIERERPGPAASKWRRLSVKCAFAALKAYYSKCAFIFQPPAEGIQLRTFTV